ncbi:hypothetical protein SEA_JUBIE_133 [Mycobacterium phage Jubie]|nr:hypothetical protein AVU96_gp057 [Mycobacterium phage Snenia]ALF01578.1 hypothetical protein SNENIA_132 [Mycobacterium phage Snenia]QPL15006.1 hypothetical protein SEA_JUBIE_133 [Mycobacterium phage Jubie]
MVAVLVGAHGVLRGVVWCGAEWHVTRRDRSTQAESLTALRDP